MTRTASETCVNKLPPSTSSLSFPSLTGDEIRRFLESNHIPTDDRCLCNDLNKESRSYQTHWLECSDIARKLLRGCSFNIQCTDLPELRDEYKVEIQMSTGPLYLRSMLVLTCNFSMNLSDKSDKEGKIKENEGKISRQDQYELPGLGISLWCIP